MKILGGRRDEGEEGGVFGMVSIEPSLSECSDKIAVVVSSGISSQRTWNLFLHWDMSFTNEDFKNPP